MIYKIGNVVDTQKVAFDSDTAKQIVRSHADITFELGTFDGLDVLVSENTDGKISSDTLVGVAHKKYYLENTY